MPQRHPAWKRENRQIAQLAYAIGACHEWYIPVDIVAIARGLGMRVRGSSSPTAHRGFMAYSRDRARGTIFVNLDQTAGEIRYTIAHEIMHAVIDRGLVQVRESRVERMCQLGAATLLMPPPGLIADATAARERVDMVGYLAHRYRVSRPAMQIQLQRLELLPGADTERQRLTAEREIIRALWADGMLPDVWRAVWYDVAGRSLPSTAGRTLAHCAPISGVEEKRECEAALLCY